MLLFSFSLFIVAQDGDAGSNDDSGGTTKIWEPDLVELWIYWHKQQYRAFEIFSHNEDTLNTVQHAKLRDYMKDLREVDEILFKRHQDNDLPKPVFLTPEAAYVFQLSENLISINSNSFTMLNKKPVDYDLIIHYVEANIKTSIELIDLVDATVKYLKGWERTNLRDNNFRDNLSQFIITKLESMVGNWNNLYRRWEVAKYHNSYLTFNKDSL